eukprot:SAG25_NODE_2153_length_1890_cov_1.774428_1_plen_129_part_00
MWTIDDGRPLRSRHMQLQPGQRSRRPHGDVAIWRLFWAIVEAARHALRGKKYHEFCVKKSLVKLCIVTSKCPVFTKKLNDALFAAKPLFTPVAQGDDVLYCNQRMMVCAVNSEGTMVQLPPLTAPNSG